MKYKNLCLGKHDDPKIPGFETMTLLIDGKTDKNGYYKKGVIVAQFFGPTVAEAEKSAEYFLSLYKSTKTEGENV